MWYFPYLNLTVSYTTPCVSLLHGQGPWKPWRKYLEFSTKGWIRRDGSSYWQFFLLNIFRIFHMKNIFFVMGGGGSVDHKIFLKNKLYFWNLSLHCYCACVLHNGPIPDSVLCKTDLYCKILGIMKGVREGGLACTIL